MNWGQVFGGRIFTATTAFVVGAGTVVVMTGRPEWWGDRSAQFWASVQAVGSVVAIAVAVWIGERQHENNRQLVLDERRRVSERDAAFEIELEGIMRDAMAPAVQAVRRLRDLDTDRPGEHTQCAIHMSSPIRKSKEEITVLRDVVSARPRSALAVHKLLALLEEMNNVSHNPRQTHEQPPMQYFQPLAVLWLEKVESVITSAE